MILAEGNAFSNVQSPIEDASAGGSIFIVGDETAAASCEQALGREVNVLDGSGEFVGTSDTRFMANFGGSEPAAADPASGESIKNGAGVG